MGYHLQTLIDLKIGNILEQNNVGPEEIVFLTYHECVVVMAANGILQTYQHAQAGDALELAGCKGLGLSI